MRDQNLNTGMYIIDKEYRILNCNETMKKMYPEVKVGDICHKALALSDSPCSTCPLVNNDVLFFNPGRKEWISANAAEMEYPGHGDCYNVQFKMRKNVGGTKGEVIRMEKLDEHLADLKSVTVENCVIAAYCDPGSPIFFANENMVNLLGYDNVDDMIEGIDGMVVNLIHPNDRVRVKKAMIVDMSEGATFESVYRILQKKGTWEWIVMKGKYIRTSTGKLATVAVCDYMDNLLKIQDNLLVKNQELVQKEYQTESLISNIPGGYHRCAAEEGYPFIYISESFKELVGFTKEEIEQEFDNKFVNMLHPDDMGLFNELLEDIGNKGAGTTLYRIRHKKDGYRWMTDSTMYVNIDEGGFYQCTIADITSYVEELEAARDKAEASSLAKSTFLFNASHDIRTPMNAIKGFSYMIEQNIDNPVIVENTVHKIQQATDTLMTLMNDVLELARIEQGKEEINEQAIDLYENGKNLYEMFIGEMQDANIHFMPEGEEIHDLVFCDNLKLTRIVMNMLSNAKKFTPAGGTVTFGCNRLSSDENTGTYRFYVRDTGIGMSKEFRERAFEQFERERTSTESGVTGSGLGLAIIKKLVDIMGGQVTIESELGKGTEIAAILTFPFVKEVATQEEAPIMNAIDMTNKRILLVEDNEFNREIAKYVLEGMGILVEEAEDGAVAVSKLLAASAGYYDLVLMDIQMPVMDGYTATREIRNISNPEIANIPIIAMTANAFKEDRDKCIDVGMNEHISKPIDADNLRQLLSELLN